MSSRNHQQDIDQLRETIKISHESRASGNHPFGATLVSPDNEVLIRSGNTFKQDGGVGHAELNVACIAAKKFDADFLQSCTLYTSVEPCCMCTGAIYWAGIGTIVYGLTEKRLAELTGDNPENLTMDMPCHQVVKAGQRKVEVVGPFAELEDEVVEAHKDFW